MAIKSIKAVINGQSYNLTYNATKKLYEATITAPGTSSFNQPENKYGVSIEAVDTAGNVTTIDRSHSALGESLKLRVKEKVAPSIVITYPGSGATLINNKPTFTWTVEDTDSGVDGSTIGITLDSGTKITSGITKTAIGGGYSCSYTPTTALIDGTHTIKLNATDNDGNVAEQKTVTFKVDTVPPTLNITSPIDGLITNNSTLEVNGITNDATSSPVTLKVNNKAVTVEGNGSFATTISLVEGDNAITIIATDSAGKTTTITRTVVLDTKAPTISAVTITPNPVDAGATYVITVSATD